MPRKIVRSLCQCPACREGNVTHLWLKASRKRNTGDLPHGKTVPSGREVTRLETGGLGQVTRSFRSLKKFFTGEHILTF